MMLETHVLFKNRSYVCVQIIESKLLFIVENRLRRNGYTQHKIHSSHG